MNVITMTHKPVLLIDQAQWVECSFEVSVSQDQTTPGNKFFDFQFQLLHRDWLVKDRSVCFAVYKTYIIAHELCF